MNLSDLRSAVYDRLGYNSTPDSAVVRRITRYFNISQREIITRKDMGRLRRALLTFTSVANSPFAVLPQAAVQILVIADRTNQRLLDEISFQDLRARDPGLTFTSSIPDAYVVYNYAAQVARDPSVAAQMYAVSDSTSDGSGISALIEGTITGGYYRRASIAMNGITPVALDSNATWAHITKFTVSGKTTGNVTLTQGSGGTELARITPGHTVARYTQIHLIGVPSSAITYTVDCELHIEDMSNPSDEPYIPEDFQWVLEAGCLRMEYLRRGATATTQYRAELGRWEVGVRDLTAFVTRRSGVARGKQSQFTQLPWNYPASGVDL